MEFERFAYDQYPQLVASLTLYCGDRWVAEELAQESLVRVWQRWDRVMVMAAPATWLYRVAMNLAASWFRRRRAERRAQRKMGTSERIDQSLTAEMLAVREAVAKLPASQRGAIVCRYFLDLSVAETADVLNLTPGSVKSATHRGLVALRRHFDLYEPEEVRDVA